MNRDERLLTLLKAPHVSEKTTEAADKHNVVVFRVAKDANKREIQSAVKELFKADVKCVRTLNVKGKTKRHGARVGRRSDWKKAYVTLQPGQEIAFVGVTE